MIPPDRQHLQALAGWSLVARHNCSDRQHLALCRFGDSCGELSDVIETVPIPRQEVISARVPSRATEPLVEARALVRENLATQPEAQCAHAKFDIHTQRCLTCNMTYRQAKGRKAELF